MNVTRTAPQACPVCDYVFDSHTLAFDATGAPGEGDFSLCIQCGAILRFGPTLKLHIVPDIHATEADDDTKFNVLRAQQHIRRFRRTNPASASTPHPPIPGTSKNGSSSTV